MKNIFFKKKKKKEKKKKFSEEIKQEKALALIEQVVKTAEEMKEKGATVKDYQIMRKLMKGVGLFMKKFPR